MNRENNIKLIDTWGRGVVGIKFCETAVLEDDMFCKIIDTKKMKCFELLKNNTTIQLIISRSSYLSCMLSLEHNQTSFILQHSYFSTPPVPTKLNLALLRIPYSNFQKARPVTLKILQIQTIQHASSPKYRSAVILFNLEGVLYPGDLIRRMSYPD